MQSIIRTSAATICLAVAGCTFVSLSEKGADVVQMQPADVLNCTTVGVVSTSTQDKVVISRGDAKVREELLVLARNQAGELGANAIVPIDQPIEGKQNFRAYQC
ncbi:MAG: DUF4156 domain-containing protein [Pseudomonadota bacterium]